MNRNYHKAITNKSGGKKVLSCHSDELNMN